MTNPTHTLACIAATERWHDRLIAPDYDRAVGLPTVVNSDPQAIVAWFTCDHRTHRSARKGFVMLAHTMPAAMPLVALLGG